MCKVLFHLTDSFEDSKRPSEKYLEAASDYDIPSEIAEVFETVFVTIDDAVQCSVTPAHVRDLMKKSMSPAKYAQTFMGKFLDPEGGAFDGSFEVGEHEVEQW